MTDHIDTTEMRELIAENVAQAEELAALRRNRAAWESSGQDAEKRSRYAESRVLLLEAEVARLGREIERRDQSLASRRKICRELVGLVRPLKARVSELEDSLAATRRAKTESDNAMPASRGTTSGQLLQLHDRAERPDAYAVADSEGGEA